MTTRAEIRQRGRLCVVDEVDVVYRAGGSPPGAHPGPTAEPAPVSGSRWAGTWRPDPVLLFRFSALTANSHRIHYDDRYAREVQGYPGVVVRGPLLALLMVEAVRRTDPRDVAEVEYRLQSPVFVGEEVALEGTADEPSPDTVRLSVRTARPQPHAYARVGLR